MFAKLPQMLSAPCIAVDLGTAYTRLYTTLCGEVTELPSSIRHAPTCDRASEDDYIAYLNNKISSKPLRGGVIVDLQNAIALLKPLVQKSKRLFSAPISLASAPTDTTENERELLRQALMSAGASHVSIIPEVWAAAIGAGIDVVHPNAQLLIDIGDGVTDMAVFRDGNIIFSSSVRTACSDIQKAVRTAVMIKYKALLYDRDVERLTHELSAVAGHDASASDSINVPGIDIAKMRKDTFCIRKKDITSAIRPVTDTIMTMIDAGLHKLPEHIYGEILESGICLTGGGACIDGMDTLIAARTGMEVKVASDPIHAVINGAIQTLNYWSGKKCWWESIVWPNLTH